MLRTRLAGALVAAATVVSLTPGSPGLAADPVSRCDFTSGSLISLLTPSQLTVHLATASPYGAVRSAASTAINSPRGEIALKEFIPTGWCQATERAEKDSAMNDHIIARVLATHAYETSPYVWSAANAAKNAPGAEKENFVRFGLEEARLADKRARDQDGANAAALRQYDRNYVALMRDTAQGEQVQIAAAYALRQDATDSDIVEFYTYAWARFGKLDIERFQLTTADQEMRWFAAVDRLQATAREAQVAAEQASGEAQKALQQDAADKWGQVAIGASSSASGWLAAQQTADQQAAQWSAIYQIALRQTGPNWKAMKTPARNSRDAWERDSRNARDRAAYWQRVVQDARDAEEDIRPVEG